MITISGSAAIGHLLADGLGGYIAVGVGGETPTENDERLAFEVYRAPIRSRSYDPTTKVIVYTTTIPDSVDFFLSEVGLMTSPLDTPSGGFIAVFNSTSEEWNAGTWTATNTRIGNEGLNLSGATAKTVGATRIALASTGLSDLVQVAYHGAGGNVEVRLNSTDLDYFSMTFPAGTGYNVATLPLSQMTKVGAPDVSGVIGVTVIHSGAGNVTMDAIRITPVQDQESIIIRQVFTPGHKKVAGMPLDVEVSLQL